MRSTCFLIVLLLLSSSAICQEVRKEQEKQERIDPVSLIDTNSVLSIVLAPAQEIEANVKQGQEDGIFDSWEAGLVSFATTYLENVGISLVDPICLSVYDDVLKGDKFVGWVPIADPDKWLKTISLDKETWDKGEAKKVHAWGSAMFEKKSGKGSLFAIEKDLLGKYLSNFGNADKVFSEDEQKIFRTSGAAAQINLNLIDKDQNDEAFRNIWDVDSQFDAADMETHNHFVKILKQTQRAVIGVGYRNRELFVRSILTLGETPSIDKILREPKNPSRFTGTFGLPRENLVTSVGIDLEQFQSRSAARVLIDALTDSSLTDFRMIGLRSSTPLSSNRRMLSLLFGEFYQHARSFQFGLYEKTDDPGRLSVIGVVDLRDKAEFHKQLDSFARIVDLEGLAEDDSNRLIADLINELSADKYVIRESAFVKLSIIGDKAKSQLIAAKKSEDPEVVYRVSALLNAIEKSIRDRAGATLTEAQWQNISAGFSIVEKKEMVGKHSCQVLKIKLNGASDKQLATLKSVFGEDLNRLRLVEIEDKLIVMFGSDLELYSKTIANVEANVDPIFKLEPIARRLSSPQSIVVHASLPSILRMIYPKEKSITVDKKDQSLSTFAAGLGKQSWKINMFVPGIDYRALKIAQKIQ